MNNKSNPNSSFPILAAVFVGALLGGMFLFEGTGDKPPADGVEVADGWDEGWGGYSESDPNPSPAQTPLNETMPVETPVLEIESANTGGLENNEIGTDFTFVENPPVGNETHTTDPTPQSNFVEPEVFAEAPVAVESSAEEIQPYPTASTKPIKNSPETMPGELPESMPESMPGELPGELSGFDSESVSERGSVDSGFLSETPPLAVPVTTDQLVANTTPPGAEMSMPEFGTDNNTDNNPVAGGESDFDIWQSDGSEDATRGSRQESEAVGETPTEVQEPKDNRLAVENDELKSDGIENVEVQVLPYMPQPEAPLNGGGEFSISGNNEVNGSGGYEQTDAPTFGGPPSGNVEGTTGFQTDSMIGSSAADGQTQPVPDDAGYAQPQTGHHGYSASEYSPQNVISAIPDANQYPNQSVSQQYSDHSTIDQGYTIEQGHGEQGIVERAYYSNRALPASGSYPIDSGYSTVASIESNAAYIDDGGYFLDPNVQVDPSYSPLTLESLEFMAVSNHPVLHQARARSTQARNRAVQSSLPNRTTLGVYGDEIGNSDNLLFGVYASRTFQKGGKRELGYEAGMREADVRDAEVEQQHRRLLTDVRISYYQVLIAQKRLELLDLLKQAQGYSVDVAGQLVDAGESPETDRMQVQVQARRLELQLMQARATHVAAWRSLASVINQPDMPVQMLTGSLDFGLNLMTYEECRANLFSSSPELRAANLEVAEADARLQRQLAGAIPDLQTQVRFGQDTQTDDLFAGFQIGAAIPNINRNQGNINAARARYRETLENVQSVKLALNQRLAEEYGRYEAAWHKSNSYLDEILPEANRTFEMIENAYQAGEIEFLQYSSSQQARIDLTVEYLDTLAQLWSSRQRIVGMLLSNSLNTTP